MDAQSEHVPGASGPASRRRGRPATPLLTRDSITEAALRLMAERGQQAFTMEALAQRLKVSTSALYNHASSKMVVLQWMQDTINATIDTDCFATEPCREALAVWARSYRDAYADYPMLVPFMAVQPVTDAPRTVAMYEAVAVGLTRGGWPQEDVVNVIVAIEAFVFGAALDLAAPPDIFETGASVAEAPVFSAAVRARSAQHRESRAAADAAFEMGLTAMLGGLDR